MIELNDLRSNENCIEWLNGQKTITCTYSQQKYVNKAKKLAHKNPHDVHIVAENADGSIVIHAPLSYFKFGKPRTMSDKEKLVASERLKKYHASK